jgi:hypothetical protein
MFFLAARKVLELHLWMCGQNLSSLGRSQGWAVKLSTVLPDSEQSNLAQFCLILKAEAEVDS